MESILSPQIQLTDMSDINIEEGLSGTHISTTKAEDALVEIAKIEGRTDQLVTTQGKNLFDINSSFQKSSGITSVKVNGDTLSISSDNTTGYSSVLFLLDINTYKGKTIVAKHMGHTNSDTTNNFAIQLQYSLDGSTKYFAFIANTISLAIPDTATNFILRILTNNSPTVGTPNVITIKGIQLELGSTATTYEPFVPNSPSIGYPSEMKYANNFDMKTVRKNLFNDSINIAGSGTTYDAINRSYRGTSGSSWSLITSPYKLSLKPNVSYTVQAKVVQNGTNTSKVAIYVINPEVKTNNNVSLIADEARSSHLKTTFIVPSHGKIEIRFHNNGSITSKTDVDNIWSELQIEENSVATSYEPYVEDKTTINLPMRSLPNGVKDTIEYVDGESCHIQRVVESVFDGNEGFERIDTDSFASYFRARVRDTTYANSVRCDRFKNVSISGSNTVDIAGISMDGSYGIRIRNGNTKNTSVSEFESWLSLNPIKVQYEIAIPIVTPLSDIYLKSYPGMTNIFTTSNPQVNLTVNTKTYSWSKQYLTDKALKENVEKTTEINTSLKTLESSLTSFQTTVNSTFKDGIIQESESRTIAQHINTLANEKQSVDSRYTIIYANANLTGTPKTNLLNAKNAYNTAYTNLITSINTAIADGKVNTTEKTDVNSKFITYKTSIGTLSTRFEESIKAIEDKIKSDLDTKITTNTTALTVTNGKISTIISESGINALNTQGKTLYDKYVTTEQTLDGISTVVGNHTTALEDVSLIDKVRLSGDSVFTPLSDDSVVHVEMDGRTIVIGTPSIASPATIINPQEFDLVSSDRPRNYFTNTKGFVLGRRLDGFWSDEGGYTRTVDEYNNTIISASRTGLTADAIVSAYSPYVSCDDFVKNGLTFSFDYKVDNLTAFDMQYVMIYELCGKDGVRIAYRDVKTDDTFLNETGKTLVNGEWRKLIYTRSASDIFKSLSVAAGKNIADVTYVTFRLTLFRNGSVSYRKPKLEVGSNLNPDWTPAPEDIEYDKLTDNIYKTKISLPTPLASIDINKDLVFRDLDGLWKSVNRLGTKVYSGNLGEGWTIASSVNANSLRFFRDDSSIMTAPENSEMEVLCSQFKSISWNQIYTTDTITDNAISTYDTHGRLVVRIVKSVLSSQDAAGFRAWLTTNPITVHYRLATPTLTTLSDDLQLKLNNLPSFKDSTYVYSITNPSPIIDCYFKSIGWYNSFFTKSLIDSKANTNTLNNEIQGVTSSYRTALDQTVKSLTASIENNVASLDGRLMATINSQIEATARSFNLSFTEVRQLIESSTENLTSINMFFSFTANGLKIGTNESPLSILLSNEEMQFLNANNKVAYINGTTMYIENLELKNSFKIGNHTFNSYGSDHTIITYSGS